MSDDKLEADIRRGQRAQEILDNEIFGEVWAKLRETYVAAWTASAPGQTMERENLYLAMGIMARIRANIEEILNTGRLATHSLDFLKQDRKAERVMKATNRGF